MKFIFLLGGAVGFTLASGTDYLAGRNPDRILFDGAVGCLVGAILLRWFWNVLLGGIRDTFVARQRAALAATASTTNPAASAAAGTNGPVSRPATSVPPLAAAARSGAVAAAATAAAVKSRT